MTPGRKGIGPLSFGGEEPFGGELAAQPLQPGQQLAHPDRADLQRGQRERAPVGVEIRTGEDDHPGPVGGRRLGRVEHRPGADDPHGHGRDRIAQGQEHRAAAHGELGDLPFHPDPAESADPPADQLQHRADGNG
jgi:hypothetical protein